MTTRISSSRTPAFRWALLACASSFLLSNCASPRQIPAPLKPKDPAEGSYWNGDSMTGSPSVRISLNDQKAYFYKDGKLAGVSAISTGREGLDTVTGHFHIIQKDRDHRSSIYGDYVDDGGNVVKAEVDNTKDAKPPGSHFVGSPMPFFMRVVGGTGMHEGYLPGYPASHGCIRMPGFMAEDFFNATSVGTPVTIAE